MSVNDWLTVSQQSTNIQPTVNQLINIRELTVQSEDDVELAVRKSPENVTSCSCNHFSIRYSKSLYFQNVF